MSQVETDRKALVSLFEPGLDLVSHFELDLASLLDFEKEDQVLVPVVADNLKNAKKNPDYVTSLKKAKIYKKE